MEKDHTDVSMSSATPTNTTNSNTDSKQTDEEMRNNEKASSGSFLASIRDLDKYQTKVANRRALSRDERVSLYITRDAAPSHGTGESLVLRLRTERSCYVSYEFPFVTALSRETLDDKDHMSYFLMRMCLDTALARLPNSESFEKFPDECNNLIPGTCSRGDASIVNISEDRNETAAIRGFFELVRIGVLNHAELTSTSVSSIIFEDIINVNAHQLVDRIMDVPTKAKGLKIPDWDKVASEFERYVGLAAKSRAELAKNLLGGVICVILVCCVCSVIRQ